MPSHPMLAPRELRLTEWKNPTKHTLTLRLYVGATRRNPTGREIQVIKPGETVKIPSEFDSAIQTVRNGRIEGGLAPQLIRIGSKPLPIHPALDTEAQARKEARSQAQRAMDAKRMAEALMSEASASLEQAESAAKVLPDGEDADQAPERSAGGGGGPGRQTGRK